MAWTIGHRAAAVGLGILALAAVAFGIYATIGKRGAMSEQPTQPTVVVHTQPPVDTQVPAETQTATFALG